MVISNSECYSAFLFFFRLFFEISLSWHITTSVIATLISRTISTQESGNLPYHVKQLVLTSKKALKKEQFHEHETREMAFARPTFQNLPR